MAIWLMALVGETPRQCFSKKPDAVARFLDKNFQA
jgi:hypothetical protein